MERLWLHPDSVLEQSKSEWSVFSWMATAVVRCCSNGSSVQSNFGICGGSNLNPDECWNAGITELIGLCLSWLPYTAGTAIFRHYEAWRGHTLPLQVSESLPDAARTIGIRMVKWLLHHGFRIHSESKLWVPNPQIKAHLYHFLLLILNFMGRGEFVFHLCKLEMDIMSCQRSRSQWAGINYPLFCCHQTRPWNSATWYRNTGWA